MGKDGGMDHILVVVQEINPEINEGVRTKFVNMTEAVSRIPTNGK